MKVRTMVVVCREVGYGSYNTDSYNVSIRDGVVTCYKRIHLSVTQDTWIKTDTLPARLRSIKRDIAKAPLHFSRHYYRKYRK